MRPFALATLSLMLLTACQTGEKLVAPPPTYQYTAYNANGAAVLTGTLHLEQSGNQVTGHWAFDLVEGVQVAQVGPQVGAGKFTGVIEDNVFIINLQPETIDNHVILRGSMRNGLFSGSWQNTGFGGVISEGSFSAIAQ